MFEKSIAATLTFALSVRQRREFIASALAVLV
jgi:hypothetical protein